MKKTLIFLTTAIIGMSLVSCGAVDDASSTTSTAKATAASSQSVSALPAIDKAEIVAECNDEGDGYMYRLDVEGDLKYWTADVKLTDCGIQEMLTISTKDYDRNSRYITGGSTISEMSAVVTPYDADDNAGKPVDITWDTERVEKTDELLGADNSSDKDTSSETGADTDVSDAQITERDPRAFVGTWGSGRCTLVVERVANNTFTVAVKWSSSAAESTLWTYDVCNYSPFVDALVCEGGGTCSELKYSEDGTENVNTLYTGSTASFRLDSTGKTLTWSDDSETRDEGMEFVLAQ